MSIAPGIETPTDAAASVIPLANPATVKAIQANLRAAGARARARFTAETSLVNGYETSVSIRDFRQTIDEPPSLGGADHGPNPVELVLAALGTCQEIVYSTYAALLNIPIERLDIKVYGDLDPRGFFGVADVHAGFESVTYEVSFESKASVAEVRALIDTVNRRCPVLDILQRPLPVRQQISLNGQNLA